MYKRVSRELRDKLEKDIQEALDENGDDIILVSFTSEEEHLRQECIQWRETINLYFLSSYRGGALKNFLHYKYIRPREVTRFLVTFDHEINWNQSWKDWFVVNERKDYASILFA